MRRLLPCLLALSALAGCSFDPHYVRPDLPVPPSWPVGDAYLRQTEAALPSVSYRDVFRDPRLQAIIGEALANNRDLRVALANIVAARAQYRIQRADLFPEIDASARYSRSGYGNGNGAVASSGTGTSTGTTGTGTTGTGTGTTGTGSGTTGTTGTTGSGGSSSVDSVSPTGNTFSLGLASTAFEIDLFGRVRSLSRAAQDRYFAQEAAARATRLTLVAEIATDWLQYAADRSLLTIAQQTVQSAGKTVQLTQARLTGGIAPRSDLTQAITVLATAQSDFASQTTLVAQDVNALQLLVGAPVDPALLPHSLDEAAATVVPLPAGVDSSVLLRRPDVVEAEYSLRATNAQIGAARAQLFPTVSITSIAGFASTAFSSLFTAGAFSYSAAPSVTYPIFQAGAARANVTYSKAERDVALATYEHTIQTAFREVGDALARRGTIADQVAAQTRNLAAAADTLTLASARYTGGVDTFLNTLIAQRTYYTTQQTFVETELTAADNLVTLYQVLGGDSTLDAPASGPTVVPEQRLPTR
ncbi:efflux transporter outer membrane subunit [uncultured Sphingomonas sp.]|uniref:efflux transporter outer membrane subunit n=1 Tax=uncultured Sphingomonas sp. TaxID=158754 RepID=UPI0035CBAA87